MTLKNISIISPKKRELVELSKFILNRKTSLIRDELCSFLVSYSLYSKEKMSVPEIAAHIDNTYGLPDFPEDRILEAIAMLLEKHEITVENKQYSLTDAKTEELGYITKSFDKTREHVQNKLISNIRKRCPTISIPEITIIIDALYQLLGTIFMRYGLVCAEAITGNLGRTMLDFPDFSVLSSELFKGIKDKAYRKIVIEEIRGLFEKPQGRTSRFFYAMAQSYALMEILNLDPECIKLSEQYLTEKKIYLDTNIIVSLVCTADPLHEAINRLISRTRKLGVGILFTTRTKTEFLNKLHVAQKLFNRLSSNGNAVFKRSSKFINDVFIRSYRADFKGSTSNWGLFQSQMRNFDGFLKERFNIREDDKRQEEIDKNPDFESLSNLVYRASSFTKSVSIRRHDAYHILLIRSLRKEEGVSPLGSRYWFLTVDNSLDRAEKYFDKEILQAEAIPSSIHGNIWLEMMEPFLHPDIIKSETSIIFSKILSSSFPVATEVLDPLDVADLSGEWMLGMSDRAIKRIVGDKFVRETLQKYRESVARKEEVNISELLGPITEKLEEELRLDVAEDAKSKYEEKILQLEERLKIDESKNGEGSSTKTGLVGLGLISLVLIIMLPLAATYVSFTVPDSVYQVLGALTAFFVGAGVFGKRVYRLIK